MLFISGAHGRKLSSWVWRPCGRVSTVKVICLHEAHTDSCALPCEGESLMPRLASSLGMHSMISGFPLGAAEPERSYQPACRSWMHQPPGPQESNVCCYIATQSVMFRGCTFFDIFITSTVEKNPGKHRRVQQFISTVLTKAGGGGPSSFPDSLTKYSNRK